jgi:hypothetical protein
MEADTGWTSPAMLNPYNSASYPDNMIVQDDDDMTILVREICHGCAASFDLISFIRRRILEDIIIRWIIL